MNNYRSVKFEARADEEKKLVLRGYPILFNTPTQIRNYFDEHYTEVIVPEAVEIEMFRDMYVLAQHDVSKVLGRSGVNVRFEKDETGVFMELTMPNTQEARDIYNLVEAGIIDGMSFGFSIKADEYNKETNTRTITKFEELFEASIVTFPAYREACVVADVRAKKKVDEEEKAREEEERKLNEKYKILEAL